MTVNVNRMQKDYYEGNSYGDYQFTSLKDIIQQFLVVYVGEGKIISKASEIDVSFHAQRALQELSFDTFKSIKSQEIILPPSLQMILPHDYVNYTKFCWSDSSGIEHTIYPTSKTSNPFKVKQDDDGNYDFGGITGGFPNFNNSDFDNKLDPTTDWIFSNARVMTAGNVANPNSQQTKDIFAAGTTNFGGKLTANIHKELSATGNTFGRHYSCWQEIDVNGLDEINISADGVAPADQTGASGATIRMGISSTKGDTKTSPWAVYGDPTLNGQISGSPTKGPNFIPYAENADGVAYVQWTGGTAADSATKTLASVDVSGYNNVFVLITMFVPGDVSGMADMATVDLTLDNIILEFEGEYDTLQQDKESKTWENFKSSNTSETNTQEYDTDNYDLIVGKRYGLDPQHSHVNGSFYIDNLKGLVHFSSNISGKTVILKYISDSLGTDQEMQVHKLAQEALYKHIMYAILSTTANIPEYIVRRYKQEKFAATRQAKLRLSNIKLEEITQILRGKSKLIKH
jgi:hypothetical protein